MIECQLRYLVDALRTMDARALASIEPTAAAQRRWNADLRRRMRRTVWTTGGCASWYQDAQGRVPTLWPGSTLRFRRLTRRVDLAEYHVASAPAPGRGHTVGSPT
jgi:hypothetical protein